MIDSNDSPTDTSVIIDDAIDPSLDEDKSSTDLATKPWDPKDIRITTKTFTLREIYTQIVDGELDLAPDFQRSFVWKDKQQVRLIESILLGIPLPAFYFNQDVTGAHQVIDGVQRLTTLKHFMSNGLALNGDALEYLSKLKGTSYQTLDAATRRRFAGTQIVAHVIEPQTPAEVKYDIFNRVNTGGSPLSAQEIRHCMSKVHSRNFLNALVESESFNAVMGRAFWSKDASGQWIRNNQRMMDREMALRFCAFYTLPVEEYAKATSLDAFLLKFTQSIDHQHETNSTIDTGTMTAAFDRAMRNANEIMGRGAFRLWTPGESSRRGPLNRAIFESQAIALADYSLEQLQPHKQDIQNAFRQLFLNPDYDTAVRVGTGSFLNVSRRLNMPKAAIAKILS
ncbi:MAG: DUF262 domain-containing protein [Rhodoferax sp.]|nr:DUF262 domain-containing protein [Rhodoferax sp.]